MELHAETLDVELDDELSAMDDWSLKLSRLPKKQNEFAPPHRIRSPATWAIMQNELDHVGD